MTQHTQDDHAHDHGFDMWASTDKATRRAFVADYWEALRELRAFGQTFARSIFTLG